ncbi:hypothetical protein [Botrimarina sp.]|uniref:hypothetical protein n=1 Tax=Botrimarina sp. TaxID=2795802 RepID=UPI0032ECFDDE
MNLSLRAADAEEFQLTAIAAYGCAPNKEDQEQRYARASSTIQVAQIPGLLIGVIDDPDVVRVGEQVEYTITVRNEGNAPAKNLKLTAKIPSGLSFVEASGETDAEDQDGQVRFDRVDELKPGGEAVWRLVAKAEKAGAVRLQANLESQSLKKPVKSEEPTRLFGGQDDSGQ